MRSIIKHFTILLVITMSSWTCSEASGHGDFTMVLSGSMHGQLDPCGWKKNPLGGLSRRSVKIKEIRDRGIDPIILDAGDLIFSTKKIDAQNKNAELTRADAMLEGFNRIGGDAINVGHYEVLNGLKYLKNISVKDIVRI